MTGDKFGHNRSLKPYPYDSARARQFLAEAGYSNGFQASLDTPNGRYLFDKEGSPYSYYKSLDFNRLLNAADTTMNPQKRKDLLNQAAEVLREDPPAAFLYREPNIYGMSERLVWKPTADQTTWAVDMRQR